MTTIQLFATNRAGVRQEISSLYWFEAAGIPGWDGHGLEDVYILELWVDGFQVFPTWDARLVSAVCPPPGPVPL